MKTQPEDIVTKELKLLLPVELSDSELVEVAQEMAELYGQVKCHEACIDASKETVKKEKKQIESLETAIGDKMNTLKKKTKLADVNCESTHDYDEKRVVVIRKDTGEIVEERDMNGNELQQNLPIPVPCAECGAEFDEADMVLQGNNKLLCKGCDEVQPRNVSAEEAEEEEEKEGETETPESDEIGD